MSEELTFGSWLRQRRKELSITQEELAERLGISGIALRKLESGERRPSGQIASLLAGYFRIPSDEHEAFVAFARTGRQAPGDVSPSAPWRGVLARQNHLDRDEAIQIELASLIDDAHAAPAKRLQDLITRNDRPRPTTQRCAR